MDLNVEFLASQNWDEEMPERMLWLRENDPVHWSDKDQVWLISKFEDVSYVSKHQEIFTSANGVRPGANFTIGLIDEGGPATASSGRSSTGASRLAW